MSVQKHDLFTASSRLGSAYPVTLPAFEGPLDLLLHLIESEKLDISEISLMVVTDQYLRTLDLLEEIEPGALADFLVIASRLLYIKSRALLPKPVPPDDEDEEDAGDALVRQLIEYRQFKEVAATLRQREDEGLRVYIRTAPRPELERRLDMSDLDMDALHRALRRALERIPDDPPMPRVKTYEITVSEQIENVRSYMDSVLNRTQDGEPGGVKFVDLLSRQWTRLEVIVTFLAVLELVKQRELEFVQERTFGEIMLVPGGASGGEHPPAVSEFDDGYEENFDDEDDELDEFEFGEDHAGEDEVEAE